MLTAADEALRATRRRDHRGDLRRARVPKWFGSTEGSAIEQAWTEVGAGATAYVVGEGEVLTRSYPNSHGGAWQQGGWEAIAALDLPGHADADRRARRSACSPRRSAPRVVRPDHRRQPARAAGPRVGGPPHRARPRARRGGGVRGHVVGRPRRPRHAALRLGAHDGHARTRRSPASLGSFGWDDEGVPAQRDLIVDRGILTGFLSSRETAPRSGARATACMRADGWNRIPLVRMTTVSLEPGEWSLRRPDRRHRARPLRRDQPLLVDRRPPPQLPVRLRDRLADRERRAHAHGQAPQLHRHHAAVLGLAATRSARESTGRSGASRTAARASRCRSRTSRTAPRPRASAASRWGWADDHAQPRPPQLARRAVALARRRRGRGASSPPRTARSRASRTTASTRTSPSTNVRSACARCSARGSASRPPTASTTTRSRDARRRPSRRRRARSPTRRSPGCRSPQPARPTPPDRTAPARRRRLRRRARARSAVGDDRRRGATAGLVAAGTVQCRAAVLAVANTRGIDAAMAVTGVASTVLSTGPTAARAGPRSSGATPRDSTPRRSATRPRDSPRRTAGAADLDPGTYPVVLAPEAVSDILDFLGYTGFSAKALDEGTLVHERAASASSSVHESITIVDDGRARLSDRLGIRLRGRGQAAGRARRRGRRDAPGHRLVLGGEDAAAQHRPRAPGAQPVRPPAAQPRDGARGRDARRADRRGRARGVRHALPLRERRGPRRGHADGDDSRRHVPHRGRPRSRPLRNLRFTQSAIEALAECRGITRERRFVAPRTR